MQDGNIFALFWLSQLGNPYYSKLEWMAAFAFRPAPRNLRSIPYYYQHIYEVWKKCDGGRIAKSARSLAELGNDRAAVGQSMHPSRWSALVLPVASVPGLYQLRGPIFSP